jgi:hypothetical protein
MNANGVPTSSPGLRGTRYPGSWSRQTSQPPRGCAPNDARSAMPDGTALRFDSSSAPIPRVGLISFGQPWAEGRKPVGLGIPYANGVSSSSLGLPSPDGYPRAGLRSLDRYPGTPSPHASQPQRGCAPCAVRSTPPDGTALRFDSSSNPNPRVARSAQPWAGGRKPVGLLNAPFANHLLT